MSRLLSYGLLLGMGTAAGACSFDSRPSGSGMRSNGTGTAGLTWIPPASSDRNPATMAVDAATDAMKDEAIAVQPTKLDAGAPPRKPTTPPDSAPVAGRPAAMSGGSRDAGAPQSDRVDASKPDAAPSASKPDAQMPSAPDAATTQSSCQPGLYAGTFSGSIQLIGLSLSTVTGTVRAQLVLDASGTQLDLHDGRVMGLDQDGNRLTSDLTGTVNCQTEQLENGKLANGIFHNVGSDSDTAFIGTAQATHASDPHSLVGTFAVEAPDTLVIGGRGTWSLIRNE
jgi:hypothetical protein